ncbi:unnamed protein product [Victoria cruziana]
MEEKMRALQDNKTWDVVDIPDEAHLVGSEWVYTIKYRPDGIIERHKARLVAKGFNQKYGIDYLETFAAVVKLNTIRILLFVVVIKEWCLFQFDVKNDFLNGDLEEEVYMLLPRWYETKGKYYKLKKALYGLKQFPRAWFGRFRDVMKKSGYSQRNGDHTLFVKRSGTLVAIIFVYVDDMIITGDDCEEIDRLKKILVVEFELKDLGKLRYFLGIELARSKE